MTDNSNLWPDKLPLTQENFVAAVSSGVINAAAQYAKWSRFYSISDYGTEHVMNVGIAQELANRFGIENISIILEENFEGITGALKKYNKNVRFSPHIPGRVDIAVFDDNFQIYSLVEGKRSFSRSACEGDILRLARYVKMINRIKGNSDSFGLFASLNYIDDGDINNTTSKIKKTLTEINSSRLGYIVEDVSPAGDHIVHEFRDYGKMELCPVVLRVQARK